MTDLSRLAADGQAFVWGPGEGLPGDRAAHEVRGGSPKFQKRNCVEYATLTWC